MMLSYTTGTTIDDLLVSLNSGLLYSKKESPKMSDIEKKYKCQMSRDQYVDVILCLGGGFTVSEKRCIKMLYEKKEKKYIIIGNESTAEENFK